MSFLTVFIPSIVFTLIVGAFLPIAWQMARSLRWACAFSAVALLIHVAWATIPLLGFLAPIARWLAIMWLGGMLAALVLLIPFAVLTASTHRRAPKTFSNSLPVAYVACFVAAGLVVSVTSTAGFVVRQEDIRIPGLPAGLDGFRIANLGDVHIGRFIDPKELARGIDAVNSQNVDLLVITGDLVDDVTQFESAMQEIDRAATPNKVIAVLGNHEEMGRLTRIRSIYDQHRSRVTLLINSSTAVTHNGETLRVVGVDYPMNPRGGHFLPPPEQNAAMSAQADAAFAHLPGGEVTLALSHHPAFFPFAAAHGAQLTLAAHTHGAQVRVFGRPLIDAYPFVQGLYRRGDSYLDVSAGFGHWLPIRFGVPREIVIVTLRSGQRE
jgi:predicted MPP superfamily phosphohydrolase